MATYSQAIKISGHVEATTNSTGTIFSCTSTQYAIVQVYVSATATIQIDNKTVHVFGATGSLQGIYVGPSQSFQVSANSGTVDTTGVIFINAG